MKTSMMNFFKAIISVNTIKKLPLGGLGGILLFFSSCEKEIDMDYHTVEPLYVVEASISEEGAVARISQTQNVTDEIGKRPVSDAQVIISSNYGEQCILNLDSAGCYSSSEIKGVEGREYTIRVQVGNYITKSTSRMQEKFSIDDT